MPSKTEEYLALAQRTANGLTRYWESWTLSDPMPQPAPITTSGTTA